MLLEKLRGRRKELGLSQVALSGLSGVSLPTIQNMEAGKGNPSLSVLTSLCTSLGLVLDVHPRSPDWDALISCGLPLASPSNNLSCSSEILVSNLKLAVLSPLLSQDERRCDAIKALLWAIQAQFPTFFRKHFSKSEAIGELFREGPTGKGIKLKRIAEAQIAKYL